MINSVKQSLFCETNKTMANKIKPMFQIKRILQLTFEGKSERWISKYLNISRPTVKDYLGRFRLSDKTFDELLKMNDQELGEIAYKKILPRKRDKRYEELHKKFSDMEKELSNTGVTKQLLWVEYRNEFENGYGYTQFCEHFSNYLQRKNVVMHLVHKPGEILQVDFAGAKISYIDRSTGELIECPVLVCVLPYSGYMYVEALPSQEQSHLVDGLNRALQFLGGVPLAIKSDNMKQFVKKSCRYEPVFTEVFEQWMAHYNTTLLAARVKKPRDKASVENSVQISYLRMYAPIRNEEFNSIQEINKAFLRQLEIHHKINFQKKPYCRYDTFMESEKHTLKPLPAEEFTIKHVTKAKVQMNYHVLLGEDKHYYSVHFSHVGKQTRLVYDGDTVEIYIDLNRVAVHKRNYKSNDYTTLDEHMPEEHRRYKQAQGWDAEYFLNRASTIGTNTTEIFKKIIGAKYFPEQTYNSCKGILRLNDKYGSDRLEAASIRALQGHKYNYGTLNNILKNNLDKQPVYTQGNLFDLPKHENIRGAQAYQ